METRGCSLRPLTVLRSSPTSFNNFPARKCSVSSHKKKVFQVKCHDQKVQPSQNQQSSWNATQEGGEKGHDYLYELGRQAANMRTEVGAKAGMVDAKFLGGFLGRDSDIASGILRKFEFRTLKHLEGDYYIPSPFLDAFGMHVAKNHMKDLGMLDQKTQVPLILGIWGPKGCGKSFNVELCCKLMGMEPIIMSAGELEDEWAGAPGLLIRERYRRAAEVVKNSGKMSCLVINDLDAGCGRFKDTQVTVNNQMVLGTLMNICDNPKRVSVGKEWRENDVIKRVPIIITANDLSTLYAPLLRDGRMEKFYWTPSDEDILAMVHRIFREDNYSEAQLQRLLDEFPDQPLDFYGALRARMYDDAILSWIQEKGQDQIPNIMKGIARRRYRESASGKGEPWEHSRDFSVGEVDLSEARLMDQARDLAKEQQNILEHKLSKDYLRWQSQWEAPKIEKREATPEELAAVRAAQQALAESDAEFRSQLAAQAEQMEQLQRERDEQKRLNPQPEPEEQEQDEEEEDWLETTPVPACEHLMAEENYVLLDIRSQKDFGRESAKGAISFPAFETSGLPPNFKVTRKLDFVDDLTSAYPDKDAKLIIMGADFANCGENELMLTLGDLGYKNVVKLRGGYFNWSEFFAPNGKKRPPQGTYQTNMASSGTMCVGSDLPVVGSI